MKIYLTGGTGFLGSNIIRVAQDRYQAEILTTVHNWMPSSEVTFRHEKVDLKSREQILKTVEEFQPDAIIHAAALLDFKILYRDRTLSWDIYVSATRHLIEAANRVGAKIVLVSSDWVFDGTQALAEVTTPPNPINYYGVLKVVGETLVSESADNGAVARVAGVNGKHWIRPEAAQNQGAGFGNLVPAVYNALQKKQRFSLWEGGVNMIATPSLASECAEMMMRIIQLDRQGIFHCCGGESVSRMELAKMTAEVFDLDPGLITSVSPDPDDPATLLWCPLPRDTGLSTETTAKQLDYQPPNVRQWLRSYRHQVETNSL
jgi:dTDP-4-dehydrorhamnose reductase